MADKVAQFIEDVFKDSDPNLGIEGRVFQPSQICKLCGLDPSINRDNDLIIKVMSVTLKFLLFLREGDILEFSSGRFKKISEDLLQIDYNLDLENLTSELEQRRIIRIPL
jgi:hypothetical protein